MNKQAIQEVIQVVKQTPVAKMTHPHDAAFFEMDGHGNLLVCPLALIAQAIDPTAINPMSWEQDPAEDVLDVVKRELGLSKSLARRLYLVYDREDTKIAGKRAVLRLLRKWAGK